MRSAIDSREHLIEVATRVFAREGFAGTSLRMIAVEAGVSAALLVHHFGSKQRLIEETIETTLGEWMREKDHLAELPLSEALSQWPQTAQDGHQKLAFFKQVMLSGGKPAQLLLERMHFEAKERLTMMTKTGVMRDVADIETAALLLAVYGMAPLILSDSIKKILGGEVTDPEISEKLARSSLELFALIREGNSPPQTKERAGEK
ncbi:MAG: TetR/AcrR family transcriptional regulator [Aquiluna sp.]|nr:TetR/AcrR family transcriptional regulator [Aquiluna sp.]